MYTNNIVIGKQKFYDKEGFQMPWHLNHEF